MNEAQKINTQLIDRPNPPVRISFEDSTIETLAQSIRERGVLVPLLVRRVGERYEVIDGDCRLEAAYRLRLREVPCVVRDASDSETHVLRMLANLDRSDPDPVSEALYIAKAIASGSISREELAAKLNRGGKWIDDRLAIAEMPGYMQDALRAKRVPLGVALELAQIDDEWTRSHWFEGAVQNGMSVFAAKDALRQYRKMKYTRDHSPSSADAPAIPEAPPVALMRCARCGLEDAVSGLHMVPVHSNPRVCEAAPDTSSQAPAPNQ